MLIHHSKRPAPVQEPVTGLCGEQDCRSWTTLPGRADCPACLEMLKHNHPTGELNTDCPACIANNTSVGPDGYPTSEEGVAEVETRYAKQHRIAADPACALLVVELDERYEPVDHQMTALRRDLETQTGLKCLVCGPGISIKALATKGTYLHERLGDREYTVVARDAAEAERLLELVQPTHTHYANMGNGPESYALCHYPMQSAKHVTNDRAAVTCPACMGMLERRLGPETTKRSGHRDVALHAQKGYTLEKASLAVINGNYGGLVFNGRYYTAEECLTVLRKEASDAVSKHGNEGERPDQAGAFAAGVLASINKYEAGKYEHHQCVKCGIEGKDGFVLNDMDWVCGECSGFAPMTKMSDLAGRFSPPAGVTPTTCPRCGRGHVGMCPDRPELS